MQKHKDAGRYVQLTEAGLNRLHIARRRYKTTMDEIIGDMNTPSVNTVKRVLRQEPVFVTTLERICDYFQRLAALRGEKFAYFLAGTDYIFVESAPDAKKDIRQEDLPLVVGSRRGWISRYVPRPNRLFTGRREVLDRMHIALQEGPAALTADPQALTGLGGIGKTQTALAYVYTHWRDYDRIFWVTADTVDALNDGLVRLAEELELLEVAPQRKKQALDRMHDWLRNETDWLLVLDNADDLEVLAPNLPRHHAGHLILTTRVRNTVKWAAPVLVDRLAQEEGALLLLRRAGLLGVQQTLQNAPAEVVQAAKELCDELDGLPLALDQAGAYLAETTGTVREYLNLYRASGLQLLDSVTDDEHTSVTITFTLALEQMARRSRFGEAAVQMVQLCAFLAPDAISEAIFTSPHFSQHYFPSEAADEAGSYDAICAAVCGYSMATRNPENKTLTIHRLVQQVTREAMNAEERRQWMERAVDAVSDATPDFEFEDWSLCELLLPQWRLCAGYIRENQIETPQTAHLLYQAGRYLRAHTLYTEAEALLLWAVNIAEKVYGTRSHKTADYLDELACLYRVLDRREDAEEIHRRAVEMMEQAKGPEHIYMTSKLHNMALLYMQYEEYSQAEPLFLRALAIHEKQACPDRLLMATAMTQLAGVYRNQKHFDQAERYCLQALEIYESLLKPDHIDIATGCNNLALLYLTMERYEEAEVLYLRALKINEQTRGKEHPETGNVVWGLARTCWKQHRAGEADALFRRAIQIYTKHFGAQHSRFARLLSNYTEFRKEKIDSISDEPEQRGK